MELAWCVSSTRNIKMRHTYCYLLLETDACRPALGGAMIPRSAADENQPHPGDVRSSSPGLLAFIPFTVAQNAVGIVYLFTICYLGLPIVAFYVTHVTTHIFEALDQRKNTRKVEIKHSRQIFSELMKVFNLE